MDIVLIVRVTARKSEVEQPRAGGRGEAEDAEAREACSAGELRSPLVPTERNGVGRGVLRGGERGRERAHEAKPQARPDQSGLQVRTKRVTVYPFTPVTGLPRMHSYAPPPTSN